MMQNRPLVFYQKPNFKSTNLMDPRSIKQKFIY